MNQAYVGHPSQIAGVEEHRLIGGRGDGMRLLEVRNGLGIHMTLLADRALDIARLSLKGCNYGYFSPSGYVHPSYYDAQGSGFLKSFTAGFLTTCGLTNIGKPSVDQGVQLPLHGTIHATPAESINILETNDLIEIRGIVHHGQMFAEKLVMHRHIKISKVCNSITIHDRIENVGDRETPLMILYHLNIGYPLLSEHTILEVASNKIVPRDVVAQAAANSWCQIEAPQAGFVEQCYYHEIQDGHEAVRLYNPKMNKGLVLSYAQEMLNYFIQWKMLGVKDYVLGLEPANAHVDGRDKMREEGKLQYLQPGTSKEFEVSIHLTESIEEK